MWPMSSSNRQGQRWYYGRVNHNDHKSLIGRREVPRYLQHCSCYTTIKKPSPDRHINLYIPPKRPFCIFKITFCQLKTVVNLLLFRSWICLRLLTRSVMTFSSVDWLSGLALMVWCCSGFDPTWAVVLRLLKLMVYCLLRNCYCAVFHPLLLTMYTTPLSSKIKAFGVKHYLYANDTQIYTLIVVQNCILAIQVWMNQNMLKPNHSKTEFM